MDEQDTTLTDDQILTVENEELAPITSDADGDDTDTTAGDTDADDSDADADDSDADPV